MIMYSLSILETATEASGLEIQSACKSGLYETGIM